MVSPCPNPQTIDLVEKASQGKTLKLINKIPRLPP
jgi:hypothetical protein